MAHSHSHAPSSFGRAFAVGVTLNGLFVLLEVVFGIHAHSVALFADAGHNLSDVLGLLLAWGASVWVLRPSSVKLTYGLKGSSILAALANSLVLLVVVGAIGWEAILRIYSPTEVAGTDVAWVAGAGIVINAVTALLFWKGSEGDLNVRAAFLHLATDAVMAFAVLIGGLLIHWTRIQIIDPILSLLIVIVILAGTWDIFRKAMRFALQGVPPDLELPPIRSLLESLSGVTAVHDLHVWGMSTTEIALTAHLVAPRVQDTDQLIREAEAKLHDQFGIRHLTLQIERSHSCSEDCEGPV